MPTDKTVALPEGEETIESKIARASGKQLWDFMRKLGHTWNGVMVGDKHRLLKLCTQRARELNKNRYGNWEQAKVEVNHLSESTCQSPDTCPSTILGYPFQFVSTKKKNMMVITNPKLNVAYLRETDGNELYRAAKTIFNS